MKLYLFDIITKEFKGETNANLDPEGKPILRLDSTPFPPPPKLKKFPDLVRVFNLKKLKWEYKEDHRGEIWEDEVGNIIEVQFIGNPKTDGFLKKRKESP